MLHCQGLVLFHFFKKSFIFGVFFLKSFLKFHHSFFVTTVVVYLQSDTSLSISALFHYNDTVFVAIYLSTNETSQRHIRMNVAHRLVLDECGWLQGIGNFFKLIVMPPCQGWLPITYHIFQVQCIGWLLASDLSHVFMCSIDVCCRKRERENEDLGANLFTYLLDIALSMPGSYICWVWKAGRANDNILFVFCIVIL